MPPLSTDTVACLCTGINHRAVAHHVWLDPARAEQWHKRMLEKGVQPNAHTFSAVISACAKGGDVAAASQHLKRMEEANIPADVVVYSSVLDACAKAGDSDSAMQIFQQMRAQDIRPNVVAYASLARPFAHRGDWIEVERLAQMMSEEGLSMNEYFLYALLLAYASARPRQKIGRASCRERV